MSAFLDSFRNMSQAQWTALLVPTLLFLILTPGFIVNVGGISKVRCDILAPLPSDSDGVCDDGTYVDGSSGYAAGLDKICEAQKKCTRWFASSYTAPWPIALHTIVFLLLSFAVVYYSIMR